MTLLSRFCMLAAILLIALPAIGSEHRKTLTEQEIYEIQWPVLDGVPEDIAKIRREAREASRYGDDCNMTHLATRERLISEANMSLQAMRDSTLSTVMEMADNLRDIYADMETIFPGGPSAYDYLKKPTQAVLNNLGPYGAIASQVTDALDKYKDWNNSEVAKDVAANVKANAQRQIEALQEAVKRLQEIEAAIDETDRLLTAVLELMRTYPQRCLGEPNIDTRFESFVEFGSRDTAIAAVESALGNYDNCDLYEMLRLLAYLNLARATLESNLEQNALDVLATFNALNAELEKFESALPKFGAKDVNALMKSMESIGTSADSSSLKASDLSPLEDVEAAVNRAKAEQALKDAANNKMKELRALLETRDGLMQALDHVYGKQRKLEKEIETWEERCNKEAATDTAMGDDVGLFDGTEVSIGTDSPEWCTYTTGTPTTFTPGGSGTPVGPVPTGGTTPGGTPTGGTPGETPGGTPTDGGGTSAPKTSCEHELEILRTYMRMHGAAHAQRAQSSAQEASDLTKIQDRIKELEAECPDAGGGDPRDAAPPAGGGTPTTTGGPTITVTTPRQDPPPDDGGDGEDPRDVGDPTITIYVKAKASVAQAESTAAPGQQIKLFSNATVNVALPGPNADKPQTDHNQEPIQGVTDGDGNVTLFVPGSAIGLKATPTAGTPALEIELDATTQGSVNAQLASGDTQGAVNALPPGLQGLLTDTNVVNGTGFLTFTFPASMANSVEQVLIRIPGVVAIEVNFCRDKQAAPNDPLFPGNRAWGQDYDNQWAIKRVGLTDGDDSAWNQLGENPAPVVVAVIDTGLDWNHLDIDWNNLWRNPGETPDNGRDDDGNGYVDDIIGWDFYANSNNPWDHDGHGTFVSGVIAANSNNATGIAGINPHARIMVLKALNNFGHTRASYLAKAIVYAVDNGAKVINMSVGGKEISTIEREAIKYAASKDVVIVVASGNEGVDVSTFGIAGLEDVVTVGATHFNDRRTRFSNWGTPIDIAAPGIEVLSLRARRTDTMRDIPGVDYVNGANYVGDDKRYYRASGTSFAAPIVAGVASLLFSKDPKLTADEVERMLLQTAKDVEIPGVDQYTGYGLVDARAALAADPAFFIEANIARVEIVQDQARTLVRVLGTAGADQFAEAWVELGKGAEPDSFKRVIDGVNAPVSDGVLGDIDAEELRGSAQWTLRVITRHKNGQTREARFALNLG